VHLIFLLKADEGLSPARPVTGPRASRFLHHCPKLILCGLYNVYNY